MVKAYREIVRTGSFKIFFVASVTVSLIVKGYYVPELLVQPQRRHVDRCL